MRISSFETTSTKYVQIYLTEEELKKQETKDIIEKYKSQKYNVALFTKGKDDYKEIIKRIILKQVELNSNIC